MFRNFKFTNTDVYSASHPSGHPDHIRLKAEVFRSSSGQDYVKIGPEDNQASDNRRLKVQQIRTNHGRLDLLQYTSGSSDQSFSHLNIRYDISGNPRQ